MFAVHVARCTTRTRLTRPLTVAIHPNSQFLHNVRNMPESMVRFRDEFARLAQKGNVIEAAEAWEKYAKNNPSDLTPRLLHCFWAYLQFCLGRYCLLSFLRTRISRK